MDESLIEVGEYRGEGYQPLIDFGEWRVAVLRYLDALQPDRIDSVERHLETDEVFVLLTGCGVLIAAGDSAQAGEVTALAMETEKAYNVKRCVWHSILLSREACVLLVENRNTGEENSEYSSLSDEQRKQILEIARRSLLGFM